MVEYHSASKRNKILTHATCVYLIHVTLVNLTYFMLVETKPDTKDNILYCFIYVKCPK